MVRRRDGRHGHPQAQGGDLGAVQEVGTEETDGDERVEEVDEDTGGDLGGMVIGTKRSGDGHGDHTAAHTTA